MRLRDFVLICFLLSALISVPARADQPIAGSDINNYDLEKLLLSNNRDLQAYENNVLRSFGPDIGTCLLSVCVDFECESYRAVVRRLDKQNHLLTQMERPLEQLMKSYKEHQASLINVSRLTGEQKAELMNAMAWQDYFTKLAKQIWNIANSADFLLNFDKNALEFQTALKKAVADGKDPLSWYDSNVRKIYASVRKVADEGRRWRKGQGLMPDDVKDPYKKFMAKTDELNNLEKYLGKSAKPRNISPRPITPQRRLEGESPTTS